jgi:flagellar biosynthesis chaperone FliJ
VRNIKKKVVYGKFGTEADVWFLKGAIETSLKTERETKAEIKQLWKQIYQLRKRIETKLKPLLKSGEEYRQNLDKKIEEIREKQKIKNSG